MENFLSRLVARASGEAPIARPVIAPIFAPPAPETVSTKWPDNPSTPAIENLPANPAPPAQVAFIPLAETPPVAPPKIFEPEITPVTEPSPANPVRSEVDINSTKLVKPQVNDRPLPSTLPSVTTVINQILPAIVSQDATRTSSPPPLTPRPAVTSSQTQEVKAVPVQIVNKSPENQPPSQTAKAPVAPPAFNTPEPLVRFKPRTRPGFVSLPPDQPAGVPPPAPTVQVTIGRIEIRASLPPPPTRIEPRLANPAISLEEFMKAAPGEV